MSNLSSASGDQASVSSGNNPPQYLVPPPPLPQSQPVKKKRNLPGNPDPDAEVVALSPKTLLSTNRFVCEICNKGFQRDQNLQLHRRGHNLPWKLKQRASKEIRKKVYVCPEPSCVHHDPSRALGDLTGIKKHYYRKHGEKKWKCDKCSKKYAVQSDWKAHSKTCGSREYRCDCGTLFSRRDSFITHRAFCDALAEESAKAITGAVVSTQQLLAASQLPPSSSINLQISHNHHIMASAQQAHHNAYAFTKDQSQHQNFRSELPSWLACPPGGALLSPGHGVPHSRIDLITSPASSSSRLSNHPQNIPPFHPDLRGNPIRPTTGGLGTAALLPPYPSSASALMSATALLQKATQTGATVSNKATSGLVNPRTHQQEQRPLGLSTIFGQNGLASVLQNMSNSSAESGFDTTSIDEAFVSGVLKKDGSLGESLSISEHVVNSKSSGSAWLTRDFLGLRPLSQSDILSIAGLGSCVSSTPSHEHNAQPQKPTW